MRLLVTLLILCVAIITPCLAGGYKVTRVVEVGPVTWIPFHRTMRWSPKGSELAYFNDSILTVTDTLGNKREVAKVDQAPLRFEWISDRQIAVRLGHRVVSVGPNPTIRIFDVSMGNGDVSGESRGVSLDSTVEDGTVSGPFRSIEGNAYYTVQDTVDPDISYWHGNVRTSIEGIRMFFPETTEFSHIYRWGEDGLYSFVADGSDSVWAAPKPEAVPGVPSDVSFDATHVCYNNGTVLRLDDGYSIPLHAFASEWPEHVVGCAADSPYFHPARPEVVFTMGFEGTYPSGKEFVTGYMCTFDYTTNEITRLDTLTGITNCIGPVFDRVSGALAVHAMGKVYIVLIETL